MSRFSAFLSTLVVLSAAILVGWGSTPAQADSVSKPFASRTLLSGSCGANSLVTLNSDRTPTSSDDGGWNLGSRVTDEILRTEVWTQNSYDSYQEGWICKDHKRYKDIIPLNYVHREKRIIYHCDPHCVVLLVGGITVTGWKQKYCVGSANPERMSCMW